MATSIFNVGGQRVGVQVIPSAQGSAISNHAAAAVAPGTAGAASKASLVWLVMFSRKSSISHFQPYMFRGALLLEFFLFRIIIPTR